MQKLEGLADHDELLTGSRIGVPDCRYTHYLREGPRRPKVEPLLTHVCNLSRAFFTDMSPRLGRDGPITSVWPQKQPTILVVFVTSFASTRRSPTWCERKMGPITNLGRLNPDRWFARWHGTCTSALPRHKRRIRHHQSSSSPRDFVSHTGNFPAFRLHRSQERVNLPLLTLLTCIDKSAFE